MGRKRKRRRKEQESKTSAKPLTPQLRDEIVGWAEEAADVHGYELWDVETTKHGRWIVRVFIDQPDAEPGKGISVDGCVEISRYLEAIFDADERIPEVYVLEVSSPGIERPLKKDSHFDRVVGEDIELVVREPVAGKNKVVARLIGREGGRLTIEFNDEEFEVRQNDVVRAKLKFDFSNDKKSGEQ